MGYNDAFLKSPFIFKLQCSLRFRKPSLLGNAETGYAPFKEIVEKAFYVTLKLLLGGLPSAE